MVCSRSNSDLVNAYIPFLYIISSSLLLSVSSCSSAKLSVCPRDDNVVFGRRFDKPSVVYFLLLLANSLVYIIISLSIAKS